MKLAPLVSVVRRRTISAGALIPFSMTTMSPTLRAELATLTRPRSVSFGYLRVRHVTTHQYTINSYCFILITENVREQLKVFGQIPTKRMRIQNAI